MARKKSKFRSVVKFILFIWLLPFAALFLLLVTTNILAFIYG